MVRPWDTASDEVKVAEVRVALEAEGGIIKRAAFTMRVSRRHLTALVAKFELREFAAGLRRQSYGRKSDQGRPPVQIVRIEKK